MFVGFDYGTSNCAMAYMNSGKAQLIPLVNNDAFMPSTLFAFDRAFLTETIWQQLPDGDDKLRFAQSRSALLAQSRAGKIEHDLKHAHEGLFFGDEAIAHYIAAPSEGYFIKSPKSFLGASGLRQQSIDFFEDIVAAMMLTIKTRAEQQLNESITQAAIGRPVNFQGINLQESNRQAQAILTAAAKRIGLRDVEFLYEPLAAGFDFETRLHENKRVLVVDIGGGTSDCSMVLMGPSHITQPERAQDFLGHTGERIGGNDFDIQLAQKILMPEFGMLSPLKTGLPMPVMPFVNAMTINDIGAQTDFYDSTTGFLLEKLQRETTQPELFQRFVKLRAERHNFAVVREAEQAKITLSKHDTCSIDLSFIEQNLLAICSAEQYNDVSAPLLQKISALILEATRQAGCQPEIVYLTGGSAKSPLIQALIRHLFGEQIPLVDGDYFGSVAAGLSVWAERIFR